MGFLRGLAGMIGFKLESVKPSNEKKDDEVGKKKNKLAIGHYITNAQGTMISRVISVRETYVMSIEATTIYARAINDIGKDEFYKPEDVKRISKKQAKKIKKAIDKLKETPFEYKDKSKIVIGDIVQYDKGYKGSSVSVGIVVDTDDSNLPLKVKVVESDGSVREKSSFLAWIKPEEVIEKIGRYNLKDAMKAASSRSPRQSHSTGFSWKQEKFRVGISNVYGEGHFPEITKEFLDGIRGPDPEPVANVAGGGVLQKYDWSDEEYYDAWEQLQGRFPHIL